MLKRLRSFNQLTWFFIETIVLVKRNRYYQIAFAASNFNLYEKQIRKSRYLNFKWDLRDALRKFLRNYIWTGEVTRRD